MGRASWSSDLRSTCRPICARCRTRALYLSAAPRPTCPNASFRPPRRSSSGLCLQSLSLVATFCAHASSTCSVPLGSPAIILSRRRDYWARHRVTGCRHGSLLHYSLSPASCMLHASLQSFIPIRPGGPPSGLAFPEQLTRSRPSSENRARCEIETPSPSTASSRRVLARNSPHSAQPHIKDPRFRLHRLPPPSVTASTAEAERQPCANRDGSWISPCSR